MTVARVRVPVLRGGELAAPARPGAVVLVAFEDQDNLGVRYLASRLQQRGHATRIVNVRSPGELVRICLETRPDVVGLSLIFQYLVPVFRQLVQALRGAGVTAHVTLGGHYASFEPQPLLAQIPEADSVVRFEGEETLVELLEALVAGRRWQDVPGLVYRAGDGFASSQPRAGREDLDELPWPDRRDIDYAAMALPTASVLGSRGCPWKCSFCSIITFYEGNGTKGRRRRSPADVVDELEHLHRERGVRVILWQDDDFLAGGRRATEWAHAIAAESIRRGLHHGLRWKISCRSDEVKPEVVEPLVRAGLTHVYMGVEAGDEQSLKHLNKLLRPEVHFRAREVLLALGCSFDFGFMLLEPWSTVDTVRNNLDFLRRFAEGGITPVGFGRMLPYAGTAAADQLAAERRIVERDGQVDYDFLDPRLDRFYDWFVEVLSERNYTQRGTANLLRAVLFEAALDLPGYPRDPLRLARLRAITSVSNTILLDAVSSALERIVERPDARPDDEVLAVFAEHHARQDELLRGDLDVVLGARRAVTGADSGAECPF